MPLSSFSCITSVTYTWLILASIQVVLHLPVLTRNEHFSCKVYHIINMTSNEPRTTCWPIYDVCAHCILYCRLGLMVNDEEFTYGSVAKWAIFVDHFG